MTAARLRILVAVDGSDASLRVCGTLVRLLPPGAEIRLLVVLSFELAPLTLLGEPLADTPERRRLAHEEVERIAGEPRRLLQEAGCSVSVTHRFGNPADEILQDAEEWQPDLLALGRRGLAGPARWLLGSTSERVVRHAHAPVLVIS